MTQDETIMQLATLLAATVEKLNTLEKSVVNLGTAIAATSIQFSAGEAALNAMLAVLAAKDMDSDSQEEYSAGYLEILQNAKRDFTQKRLEEIENTHPALAARLVEKLKDLY